MFRSILFKFDFLFPTLPFLFLLSPVPFSLKGQLYVFFFFLCSLLTVLILVVVEKLEFFLVDWPLNKEKQLGKLNRSQDLPKSFQHWIIAMAVVLDLLLLLKNLPWTSQYFLGFLPQRLSLLLQKILVLQNNLLAHFFDLVPPTLKPCVFLPTSSTEEMSLIGSTPQNIPIYIGQIPVDHSFVQYIEDSLSFTPRGPNSVKTAIEANIDFCIAFRCSLFLHQCF